MEQEPINTTAPWSRRRSEPWTQVDAERAAYERAAYEAMTKPGNGAIHPMSITTPTYEPNRAMVPDANSIISKKGKRQPNYDKVVITRTDKAIVTAILLCLVLMLGIGMYVAIKLG